MTRPLSSATPQSAALGGFIAGTLVHTKEGLKPIEQIQVGDWVLSRPENPEDGTETAYKRVVKTFRFEDKPVAVFSWMKRPDDYPSKEGHDYLRTKYEWVWATPNHPVWVQGHGWKAIDSLFEPGTKHKTTMDDAQEWESPLLRLADGSACHIGGVSDVFRTDQPHVVYADEAHQYLDSGSTWDFSQSPPKCINPREPFDFGNWPVDETDDAIPFTTTVYNIEAEDWHTYFVGEMGLWVHNTHEM